MNNLELKKIKLLLFEILKFFKLNSGISRQTFFFLKNDCSYPKNLYLPNNLLHIFFSFSFRNLTSRISFWSCTGQTQIDTLLKSFFLKHNFVQNISQNKLDFIYFLRLTLFDPY